MKKLCYSLIATLFVISFSNAQTWAELATTANSANAASSGNSSNLDALDGVVMGPYSGSNADTSMWRTIIIGHEQMHTHQGTTVNGTYNGASKNVVVGYEAAKLLKNADNNTVVGWNAATKMAFGAYNTVIGSNAGIKLNINSGSNPESNVIIGHNSTPYVVQGDNNVFIGTGSGTGSDTADNKNAKGRIAIGKSATSVTNNSAVIGAAYNDANSTGISAIYFGGATGTAAMKGKSLELENGETIANATDGTITVSGNITVSSDLRLKDNIETLGKTLSELIKLDGKSYERNGIKQIGLLAQDVQTVYPELVVEDAEGMLAVDYQALVPVLINAVKEQENKILRLENLVNQLLNK